MAYRPTEPELLATVGCPRATAHPHARTPHPTRRAAVAAGLALAASVLAVGPAARLFGLAPSPAHADEAPLSNDLLTWWNFHELFSGQWWADWADTDRTYPLAYDNPDNLTPLGIDISSGLTIAAWATEGDGLFDLVLNGGEALDAAVRAYYERALLSLLATFGTDANDPSVQQAVDDTMGLDDWATNVFAAAAGAVGASGSVSTASSLGLGLLSAAIDLTGDAAGTFVDLSTYEGLNATYTYYRQVLDILVSSAQDNLLRGAASEVAEALDACYAWRLNVLGGYAADAASAESDWFFSVLPEVVESAGGGLDELGAIANVATLLGALQTGMDLGTVVADVAVGGRDAILRYYEMALAAALRRGLVDAIDGVVAQRAEGDMTLVADLYRLGSALVYTDLRGIYCLWSLVQEGGGLWGMASRLLGGGEVDPDAWYASARQLTAGRMQALNRALAAGEEGTAPDGDVASDAPADAGASTGRTELRAYLGTDIYAFVDMVGGMPDAGATSAVEFNNGVIIVSSPVGSPAIDFISINADSPYAIYGVYWGMPLADAAVTLAAAGGVVRPDYNTPTYQYCDMPDGTDVSIHAEDAATVDGINLFGAQY